MYNEVSQSTNGRVGVPADLNSFRLSPAVVRPTDHVRRTYSAPSVADVANALCSSDGRRQAGILVPPAHSLATCLAATLLMILLVFGLSIPSQADEISFPALSNAATAPEKPAIGIPAASEVSPVSALGNALKGLGICIGTLLVGVWAVKKFKIGSKVLPSRRMRVIERLPLTQKSSLLLLEIDGTKTLVGVGPDRISFAPELQRNVSGDFDMSLMEEREICEKSQSYSA